IPMPTAGIAGGLIAPHGTDAKGNAWFEGSAFDPDRGTFTDSAAIVRWNPRDGTAATVARVSNGGRVMVNMGGMNASMARSITPFPSLDAWVVTPRGEVLILRPAPFRIDRVGPEGVIRMGSPIAFTPIPIDASERAEYQRRNSAQRMTA